MSAFGIGAGPMEYHGIRMLFVSHYCCSSILTKEVSLTRRAALTKLKVTEPRLQCPSDLIDHIHGDIIMHHMCFRTLGQHSKD